MGKRRRVTQSSVEKEPEQLRNHERRAEEKQNVKSNKKKSQPHLHTGTKATGRGEGTLRAEEKRAKILQVKECHGGGKKHEGEALAEKREGAIPKLEPT